MDLVKKLVLRVVASYLGRFVDGLDTRNLEVAVWNGRVQLQDLALKQSVRSARLSGPVPGTSMAQCD